jgi:hypothetical protein
MGRLGIPLGLRAHGADLTLKRFLRLAVDAVDLRLEARRIGEEPLVELRGEVQRHPDALEILAGLAVQADVDEKRHPPPPFCGGADEAQKRTTPPVRAGLEGLRRTFRTC